MVKKGGDGGLITKIAELVNEKKLTEISDIQDHSDRNGMRLVIELKRDANPKVVLNKLYKHTPMQIDVRREHGRAGRQRARTLSLREVIRTTSATSARSSSAAPSTSCARSSARVHRLEGLLIALDHLDEVIALIRALARPRRGAHRPDGALRAHARSRPRRSSTCACSS